MFPQIDINTISIGYNLLLFSIRREKDFGEALDQELVPVEIEEPHGCEED